MNKNKRGKDKNFYRLHRNQLRALERLLFPEGMPKFHPPVEGTSFEVLLDLFILQPLRDTYELDDDKSLDISYPVVEQFIYKIMSVDNRDIVRYKVQEDFFLEFGYFTPMSEVPKYQTERMTREIKKGDTLLMRRDLDDLTYKVEIQILKKGLFQQENDDYRIFVLTTLEFLNILRYITREERVRDGSGFTTENWYKDNYKRIRPR